MILTTDDIWPRDEEHRYRLYVFEYEKDHVAEAKILAAGPSLASVGEAFGRLLEEREFHPLDRIGVLDTGATATPGVWVMNPYA